MSTEVEAVKQVLVDFKQGTIDPLIMRVKNLEDHSRTRKWASVPGVNEGKDQFSFFKAVRGIVTKEWKEAGYEKEVMDTAARKALGYTDDTAGGYLVPAEAFPELIELLLPNTIVYENGARIIPDLMGAPVLFPKLTGGCTVGWMGDNNPINPSQEKVGQIQLTPHKAAAMVQCSNSLIRMALPAAETVIREDIARHLGLAVDIAALRGSGTNDEPLGIANTPGILTANAGDGFQGGIISNLDLFSDMEFALENANALRGKLAYAFSPAVRRLIKKMKVPMFSNDVGSLPLVPFWTFSGMTPNAIAEALGYPFATTTQIPTNLTKGSSHNCTEVYFGNWEELLIGQWAGLRILASDVAGTAFASDQTWIRVIMEVDVALRHPQSFCLCNDLAIS